MAQAAKSQKVKTRRRIIEGIVISNKMQKTIVIETSTLVRHPKYGKYYRKYKKLKAHDEKSECRVGDRVQVIESSPISKEKRFRLLRVVEKTKQVDAAA